VWASWMRALAPARKLLFYGRQNPENAAAGAG
jgi:hypothetical protein